MKKSEGRESITLTLIYSASVFLIAAGAIRCEYRVLVSTGLLSFFVLLTLLPAMTYALSRKVRESRFLTVAVYVIYILILLLLPGGSRH